MLSTGRKLSSTLLLGTAIALVFAAPNFAQAQSSTEATTSEAEKSSATGATETPAILIEAEQQFETATSPVEGFVATQSGTATKTDTPISKTPRSMSVVGADEIDARQDQTVMDALKYSAGVQPDQFGYDTRYDWFKVRGFSQQDTGLYRDGLQLRSSGYASFRQEAYGAERIELLRGPTSVMYGQNSPGGLVNVVTKRPHEDIVNEVTLEGGSFEHKQGAFDVGGKAVEDGSVLYRLTGLVQDSGTQTDMVDDDRIYIAPSLKWENDDTSLTILTHYQHDETGSANNWLPAVGTIYAAPNGAIPVDVFTGEPSFEGYERVQTSFGYEFSHDFTNDITFRQNARYAFVDVDYKTVYGNGWSDVNAGTLKRNVLRTDQNAHAITIDNQVETRFDTGTVNHTLLTGVDYQHYIYDRYAAYGTASDFNVYSPSYGGSIGSLTTWYDDDITLRQLGLYAQDQIEFDDNWTLTLSGRQDWSDEKKYNNASNGAESSKNDQAFSGQAGLVYKTSFGLAPYISYSESFNPVASEGSQSFDPETGQQMEIGAKYEPQSFNGLLTAALYDLRRQNVTTADPDDSTRKVQTGEVRSRGLELEGTIEPFAGFVAKAAYSYNDAEITKDNDGDQGNTPLGVPEHTASFWADYTLQTGVMKGFGFNGGVRYLGEQYGDDANTFAIPSTTLFDAGIHYEIDGYLLALNATNLADERWVSTCSGSNVCYYGQGRTILATVKYRW
ncbi:MAG: TonB-dependent siderophore receptor [Porticoccaceae bacterium]|uniref:TonB-dependent siderophore receptor n=1 Tax=Thalassospira sp. TaxID=1912094 RepID=UPI003A8384D5